MQLTKFVKFREEQFGGVLFETQTEKVYTLNSAAAAIIQELKAGYDVAQITARLKDRFEDPDGKIERDVRALIVELEKKGLIGEAVV